jgi:hypothetical protein
MIGILRGLSRFSTAQEIDKSTGTIALTLSIARGMFHFFVHIFPKLVPGFSQLLIYRSHDSPQVATTAKAGQNGLQQGRKECGPRGVLGKYVEGFERLRTKLGAISTSLLKKEVALGHRKHRHRITCQDLPISFYHIGFRIHVNGRQRIVQLHIALADAAAFLHRCHTFLQAE